ncbi:hydroxyacid dehydrogenase [uncultured Nisaea sp.]|uniref:hydroxyacid dehydrogenase n=1 Tax=uncultured Nisaea sp. TaxID=538215 RepID=UPI0030EEFE45|tara:strand:- start:162 stop:1130 length:969 start_codon:yes stop_codon:yes gene_type:complete
MNKFHVLVVDKLNDAGQSQFDARDDVKTTVLQFPTEEELIAHAHDIDAIAVQTTKIPRAVIEAAPNLKVVSRHGVGYDSVDVAALTERGIPLCVAATSNAVSVAEHTMYFILSLAKKSVEFDHATRNDNFWIKRQMGAQDIADKSVLLVGFGRIGTRVAKRALAFDMKVSVIDPFVDDAVIKAAGCTPVHDLAAVLPQMDFVSLHCPKSPETVNLMGKAQFAAMKPTAHVINTARGGMVDEDALYDALTSGAIAGAGIDVFASEPPKPEHPLFQLDNIIVSPHSAGVTEQSILRMASQTAENVLNVLDGKPNPDTVINKEVL